MDDARPEAAEQGDQRPTASAGIELARTLRCWREKRNRSQTWVAKELGTKQPTVSRWESGASLPSPEVIRELWRICAQPGARSGDAELRRALGLHERAEAERERGPRQPPAPEQVEVGRLR